MRQDVSFEKIFEGPNMVLYYVSNHILYAEWYGHPSPQSVKESSQSKSELVKKTGCQLLLNDTRRLTGSWSDSIEWLREVHFPNLIANGLQRMAHVYSIDDDMESFHSMNTFLEFPIDLEVQVFTDFESASQWLCGEPLRDPKNSNTLSIKSNGRIVKLNCEDILFISRFDRKSIIQLKDEEIISSLSLSQFEEMLPLSSFMRVHKSYVINVKKINNLKYHAGGYYRAYFEDFGNAFVTVSKLHSRGLKEILDKQ